MKQSTHIYKGKAHMPEKKKKSIFASKCDLHQFFFFLNRAAPQAYGSSQVMDQIGAMAASLHHSHSNLGSKLHLQPIPELIAMPYP